MSHFDKSFTDFFKQLSTNNTSAWFAEHRKIYESSVKNPFKGFVDEMIGRIQKHQPEIAIGAADAIHRINKDIRFSKDKTPYNTMSLQTFLRRAVSLKKNPGFIFNYRMKA